MQTHRIKKADLGRLLVKNMQEHITEHEAAMAAFAPRYVARVTAMLAAAEESPTPRFEQAVDLPEPQSHAKDYEDALFAIQLSADEIIELNDQEFRQLCLDDWSWKRLWKHVNATYGVG